MTSTATRPRSPVKALALPALTISARAWPRVSAARHHSTSGDGHLLCVVTPATAVPSVSSTNVRSQRPQSLYPARAMRGVAPAILASAGHGRARGEMGEDMAASYGGIVRG